MKNILYIHDVRFVSGLERVLLNIFKTIDRTKFTPYFIGSKWSDRHFIKLAKGLKIKYSVTNLRFISRTCSPFVLIGYFFDFFMSSLTIYNFIRQNKIDIISANSLHDVFYAFVPAFILRKPIIWHEHAIRPIDAFRRFTISVLDIKVNKYIAVSEAVKKGLCLLGVDSKKIDVIYNAVDLDKFLPDKEKLNRFHKTYNLKENAKLIGLISQLQPGKGHEDFLQAAKIISNEYNNVSFLIVGKRSPTKYLDKIERLTKTLELADKVIFTDWIEDIEDISLSLYTLVQPTYIEEACAVVLLEAMASGVPVVAARSGGIPEIIKDGVCGYLVNKNDPEAIAEKLKFLLDNPQIAKNMGQKAREIARDNFDLSKTIKKLENIYEKFI